MEAGAGDGTAQRTADTVLVNSLEQALQKKTEMVCELVL